MQEVNPIAPTGTEDFSVRTGSGGVGDWRSGSDPSPPIVASTQRAAFGSGLKTPVLPWMHPPLFKLAFCILLTVGGSLPHNNHHCPSSRSSTSSIRMSKASSYARGAFAANARKLMVDVYGDWGGKGEAWAPLPMPRGEAGDLTVQAPGGGEVTQRRYLWTDAFGVLNFVSLARGEEGEEGRRDALNAARALIRCVHSVLGSPREGGAMALREGPAMPGCEALGLSAHRGLRIGKEHAKKESDAGMRYDGMYAHYVDKWLFALARFAREAQDGSALRCAVQIVRDVHPAFFRGGEGILWKVNTDLRPVKGMERTGPSSDAATFYVVYNLLLHEAKRAGDEDSVEALAGPIADLKPVYRSYCSSGMDRGSADPLGFGLDAWLLQWMGQCADPKRQGMMRVARSAMDVDRHISLPFRLYGALMGGRLADESMGLESAAVRALEEVVAKEMATAAGQEEHSGINKVMLASALNPSSFARFDDDVRLELP